jgi:hypothetical protein
VILGLYGETQVSSALADKQTMLSKKAVLNAVSLGVMVLSPECYCGWIVIARGRVDDGFYFFAAIDRKAVLFGVLTDHLFAVAM